MARFLAPLLVLAAAATAAAAAGRSSEQTVDRQLCPFPLQVSVAGRQAAAAGTSALRFTFVGPSRITLRNGSTGRTATLDSPGAFTTNTKTGSVTFRGRQVWFWAAGKHVPFLTTTSPGALVAPIFVLNGATRARVVDPCALVAPVPPSLEPATTPAPWPLPAFPLSRIARAHLTPILGALRRHDHVHLDVIVDGRHVTVPAGVGLVEPLDTGPCTAGLPRRGDCGAGHFFVAQVANSPLHTHSASGLIHVESDRRKSFTLGQFFAEWGVRLDASCVGGYCTGSSGQLRVFVNGKHFGGDPQRIVLTNHQEIAVVFGPPRGVASVPSTYRGGWPGLGCGGPGERSCLP
jgi:hypothetical protein